MLANIPADLLGRIGRELDRVQVRAHNGLRHLGGIDSGAVGVSPKAAVWRRDSAVLYRYDSDAQARTTPILLVMSLITKPYVFDLRPGSSLVEDLLSAGFDVFLLDWGVAGPADAHNGIDTYCDQYLPRALDAALQTSSAGQITVFGYCLGALLTLLSVAGNPSMAVRNLVLLATPADLRQLGTLANLLSERRLEPEHVLDETGNVSAATMLAGFRMVQPTAPLTTYVNLWRSLADTDALAAHNALIGWSNDHIPFPGTAFVQIVDLFLRRAMLLTGKVPVGDRVVELSTIRCPVLNVVGGVG